MGRLEIAARNAVFAVVDRLRAGEEGGGVHSPIEIATGAYRFMVKANTESVELQQDNNAAEQAVEVEYIELRPLVLSSEVVEYNRDRSAVVAVTVLVTAHGPRSVQGLTGRLVMRGRDAGETKVETFPAGGRETAVLTVTLPQGETPMVVYAGARDDGYRWGAENVQEDTVTVPHLPPVRLTSEAQPNVAGYWSNGTATLELAADNAQ